MSILLLCQQQPPCYSVRDRVTWTTQPTSHSCPKTRNMGACRNICINWKPTASSLSSGLKKKKPNKNKNKKTQTNKQNKNPNDEPGRKALKCVQVQDGFGRDVEAENSEAFSHNTAATDNGNSTTMVEEENQDQAVCLFVCWLCNVPATC